MEKTLYGLTPQEARTLLDACNGDIGRLAVVLWDKGRASSIERGVYKAKRLAKHAREAERA